MASSNTCVFLTIFLLFSPFFSVAAAGNLVGQECTHAPKLVSSLNPNRCVQLLSTDPKAAKATTLKELAIIGLQLGVKNAEKTLKTINAATGSSDLKSVLKAVADQVKLVSASFKSALSEVKDDDFQTANYDCFAVSDLITHAKDELKKAKENVDVYEASINTLSDFGLINYVLTNDADV